MFSKSILFLLLLKTAHADPTSEEVRFFEIYSKHHSAPTTDEAWDAARKKADSREYELQPGDNLWELSEVLFGDPQYWPKIWSLNSDSVSNPHQVKKGFKVMFSLGGEEPPRVDLVKEGAAPSGNAANNSTAVEVVSPEEVNPFENMVIEIPPPAKAPRPVSGLPTSLPTWSFRSPPDQISSVDFRRDFKQLTDVQQFLPFSVVSVEPKAEGRIVETQDAGEFAMDGLEVFVHFSAPPTAEKYLVIQPGEQIFDPFRKRTTYERRHVGELQLLGIVNSRRKIYRAKVLHSLLPVQKGAEVISGAFPVVPTVNEKPASLEANVRVFGGPLALQRKLGAEGYYVFLSGGESKGLRAGQLFALRKFSKLRNPKTWIEENEKKIGEVLIVHTDRNVSTGLVLASSEEILTGDYVSALDAASEVSAQKEAEPAPEQSSAPASIE